MVYSILEANMERLEKKLTRIQNKCKRFGCSFTYEKVGEEFKTLKDERGVEYKAKFILIEAEGKAVLNDWVFVASVQHTEKGNIINSTGYQMYMTCMISNIQTMSANTKIHHSFICINTFLKRTIQEKSSGICISCLFQRSTSNSQRKKTCSSSGKDCRKNWTRKNHNWFK